MVVPPIAHPKMIIFSRKTDGCWVLAFKETPKNPAIHVSVSENSGTPQIIHGFSIINHPFFCTPIFGNTYVGLNIPFLPWKLTLLEPRLPAANRCSWLHGLWQLQTPRGRKSRHEHLVPSKAWGLEKTWKNEVHE